MVMHWGRAGRMSPRASSQVLAPKVEVPAPLVSSGRRLRAGLAFLDGYDARPVHNTAPHPFQDAMAQRGMCSKGRAPHSMFNIGRAEGCEQYCTT
jgi:hypothetical protein